MKILITTDWYDPATNGVVISVKNLTRALTARGHDVRILTVSADRHSHRDGPVYCIRSMPAGIYPNARVPLTYRHALIRELIEWKPDVIHSQCELCTMQFARHISRRTGAPIVHTYHTMYEEYVRYIGLGKRTGDRAVRVLTKRRLRGVSLVIAPTEKMRAVLEGYGIETPIRVVPSGISLAQHRERLAPETRSSMRRALGIGEAQPTLVCVGRLGAEKNISELLRFFAAARRRHPTLAFLIVGDGPIRALLEEEAASLGIADAVVFTGMVDPKAVQNYYQLGDVFVCASTSEAQGLTYVEAAANGLPLLCRQDSCLGGVIEPGENGFAYESEAEFDAALDRMLSDPDWRARAARRSEEISEAFDTPAFGRAAETVYAEVIAAAKRGEGEGK